MYWLGTWYSSHISAVSISSDEDTFPSVSAPLTHFKQSSTSAASVFLPMLHAAQSFERESTHRLIGSEIFPSAAPGVFLSDILLLASNKRAASSVFLHLPPGAHRYNTIKEQTHNYTQTAFKCSDDLLKMKLVNSKMISGEVMNSTFRF